MSHPAVEIERHYGRGGVSDRVLAALQEAGKDLTNLSIDDLAPIDEFHSRRRQATRDLADMLAPKAAEHLLDIGSGLGGPARYLAQVRGCRVTGVDLTAEFVATAVDLTRRTRLTDRVVFQQGSALDLPFPDASFDLAWSQNVAPGSC
jgi:SAM-dependent methyltransferase